MKRLVFIVEGDGEMIFELVGIEPMLVKCPRFSAWIKSIVEVMKT